jgi:hypothetical protein
VRGGGLAQLAASSWVTRCGGTSGDSSCRKRGRCRARWDRWIHTEAVVRRRGIGLGLGRWCSGGRGAPVIFEALSSYKGVNGGVRHGSYWSRMVRIHGSQVKAGAAASASKLAERGTVSGARETSRAIGTAGEDMRVLGLRQRARKREKLGTGGFKLMGTRGGEGEGNGGGSGSVRGHAEKWRRGPARSEGGLVTCDDMAQTRWLWATPTALGSAHLGAWPVNRGGRRRAQCGTARLTGGAGTRRGPVAVAEVRAGVRASGRVGLSSTVPGGTVKPGFELKSKFK